MEDSARTLEALERLREAHEAETALKYSDPLELLVATVLSAQCTDARVNEVTEELFEKYGSAEDFAGAGLEELAEDVRSTGFFNQKANYVREACRAIVEEHGGEVPGDMDALVELHGVGRKTANVVLSEAFGETAGIAVDTHVSRVSARLGLTDATSADAIERDLVELLPKDEWWEFNKLLVEHGRATCDARSPECGDCVVSDLCPFPG